MKIETYKTRSTAISLMRKAVHALCTHWSIEYEHLKTCESYFNRFEKLLNHEVESGFKIKEEVKYDNLYGGTSIEITLCRLDCGYYYEYLSADLTYFNSEPCLSFYYILKETKISDTLNDAFTWNVDFDEKQQLYEIRFEQRLGYGARSKLLWGYRNNKRIYKSL